MNILGHAYIATQAAPGDRRLLIIGSALPESSPFIKDNPFAFEEIHEGGEKLWQFLIKRSLQKRDLALGMMAHSAKFGADKWNREIERYAAGQRQEFIRKIAEASKIEPKTAELRLHNFLWWGVDWLILRNDPKFVGEVAQALRGVNVEEISRILAECFGKSYEKIQATLRILFKEVYRPEDLVSIEGLARIWARQSAGLPEKDKVDIPRAAEVIQESASLLKNDWQELVKSVVVRTRENLRFWLLQGNLGS